MKETLEKLRIYGAARSLTFALSELRYRARRLILHSYSQRGEDLIVDELLGHKPLGSYIDVGANDPSRFNNTMRFYRRGWTGLNIEPDRQYYLKLLKKRPRDLSLNIGADEATGYITFYRFLPGTLSTFSRGEADRNVRLGYKLLEVAEVRVMTLASIFAEHVTEREVDFMSVDTEGFDLKALKGNDWARLRPRVIVVESSAHDSKGERSSELAGVDELLESHGYLKAHDTGLNAIYTLR